jgi:hypothetical protein
MESAHTIHVARKEFNKLLPVLTDIDGSPLADDILVDAVDAYGWLEIQGTDNNKIKIMIAYNKED